MENKESTLIKKLQSPQCQFFVVRKKRLCRMTVKPDRQFCGEHEPEPQKTNDGQNDIRIPCPNDPKHTCYASKMKKHLEICNARPEEVPPYIVENINAPPDTGPPMKVLLSQVSKEKMAALIEKINNLYDRYVKDNIEDLEEQDIHQAVLEDFEDAGRTESSRKHLRQVSSLLRVAEREGLVRPDTCYVELGAGKGHLSYYAWRAWCASAEARSSVLLVDRASLRHKRDNKLRSLGAPGAEAGAEGEVRVQRLRADLAHVSLERVPAVATGDTAHVVGLAKHLCGAATDYALRCVSSAQKTRGALLATCCHHRCRWPQLLGRRALEEVGIDRYEFEVMLRMVSWATCGDGRPRGAARPKPGVDGEIRPGMDGEIRPGVDGKIRPGVDDEIRPGVDDEARPRSGVDTAAGMRARLLLDWARVRGLRARGFNARLVRYVPARVTPDNVCVVVTGRLAPAPL